MSPLFLAVVGAGWSLSSAKVQKRHYLSQHAKYTTRALESFLKKFKYYLV